MCADVGFVNKTRVSLTLRAFLRLCTYLEEIKTQRPKRISPKSVQGKKSCHNSALYREKWRLSEVREINFLMCVFNFATYFTLTNHKHLWFTAHIVPTDTIHIAYVRRSNEAETRFAFYGFHSHNERLSIKQPTAWRILMVVYRGPCTKHFNKREGLEKMQAEHREKAEIRRKTKQQ